MRGVLSPTKGMSIRILLKARVLLFWRTVNSTRDNLRMTLFMEKVNSSGKMVDDTKESLIVACGPAMVSMSGQVVQNMRVCI